MDTITIITVVCSILAALVFLAVYVRGFSRSIAEHGSESSKKIDGDKHFLVPICIAVAASGLVIMLLGVSPLAISLAPLLLIASAAVIGGFFFVESRFDV